MLNIYSTIFHKLYTGHFHHWAFFHRCHDNAILPSPLKTTGYVIKSPAFCLGDFEEGEEEEDHKEDNEDDEDIITAVFLQRRQKKEVTDTKAVKWPSSARVKKITKYTHFPILSIWQSRCSCLQQTLFLERAFPGVHQTCNNFTGIPVPLGLQK